MNEIQLNTSVSTEFMNDFYCIETYINEDGDVCEKNTRIPMQEAINKLRDEEFDQAKSYTFVSNSSVSMFKITNFNSTRNCTCGITYKYNIKDDINPITTLVYESNYGGVGYDRIEKFLMALLSCKTIFDLYRVVGREYPHATIANESPKNYKLVDIHKIELEMCINFQKAEDL